MKEKTSLIRLKQVMERTGYSKAWIYRLMGNNEFPKSIKLGVRSIAFVESEVEEWIQKRIKISKPGYDEIYSNGENNSFWNSCAEVEPKKLDVVLVYSEQYEEFNVARYMGNGKYRWYIDKSGKVYYCRPTQWMRLPKRP